MLGKIEGRRRRGQQRMRWLDGITDSKDTSMSKLRDGEGQGGLACYDSWGRKESDRTERLNWTISLNLLYCKWFIYSPESWSYFRLSWPVGVYLIEVDAKAPVLWPPDAKSLLIRKDPDAGRDWGQEEKGAYIGWDGLMASPTWWTWVWASSENWWWTGRPGMLPSTGSQKVRHDWMTKQHQKWLLPWIHCSFITKEECNGRRGGRRMPTLFGCLGSIKIWEISYKHWKSCALERNGPVWETMLLVSFLQVKLRFVTCAWEETGPYLVSRIT